MTLLGMFLNVVVVMSEEGFKIRILKYAALRLFLFPSFSVYVCK